MTDTLTPRTSDLPVDRLFIERWSPRSFTGEEIPVETLMTMFEAARWAPSASNSQPWRFVYARRGTPAFDTLLSLLVPGNQAWSKNASALAFICSAETNTVPDKPEPQPLRTHSFDAGSAWMSLTFQARLLGWYTHGMAGVNYAQAAETLKVPLGFKVEAGLAIGKLADAAQLPEHLQKREVPSDRKPLADLVFESAFPG